MNHVAKFYGVINNCYIITETIINEKALNRQ